IVTIPSPDSPPIRRTKSVAVVVLIPLLASSSCRQTVVRDARNKNADENLARVARYLYRKLYLILPIGLHSCSTPRPAET
ncbi:MAG: hypothetical protein LC748_09260, partial [Thermomicrobia bacterium]|nr:hypothetical protein [Thermomicrobia bacterium]